MLRTLMVLQWLCPFAVVWLIAGTIMVLVASVPIATTSVAPTATQAPYLLAGHQMIEIRTVKNGVTMDRVCQTWPGIPEHLLDVPADQFDSVVLNYCQP